MHPKDALAPYTVQGRAPVVDKRQIAQPSSTVSAGGWTSSGANLYAPLDELWATEGDDTDYITSGASPSNDVAKLQLGVLTTPEPGPVMIYVRGKFL